ncbi:DMT family transporter [Kitasatospora sp. MAP5-34]|uniref:DMT family transporter n=1 Tax=Kitasatospora sp. MAP5-34 TaxID=3035102 RepID=UPI002473EF26|nr:DMT family transporter [Kitasatospora sp. MAP5-34]MDH6578723.1 drug/metabolite transporter (DMT)-like permease [Kitasatospora sp. MAP5-34]
MNDQKNYVRGVLLCLTATLSWGAMFPIMDVTLKHIDPFTFTCMRYGIAGLIFLAVLFFREGRSALNLKGERVGLAWLFGTAGFAGFQFLVFYGQDLIGKQGALIASIMMATMPMMGFLVNWVLRKVVPPKWSFAFIGLSFVGILLVVTKGDLSSLVNQPQNFGADALLLFAALCWVIYTSGATYFPKWSPIKYTTITTGLGLASAVVITAVILAVGGEPVPTGSAIVTILPELAYMSIVAGFVGVLAWNIGNKNLGPLNGVLFMDVVPVTAFTISALTGVIPAAMQIVGALFTASALVLNNLYLRRRAAAAAQAAPAAAAAPVKAKLSTGAAAAEKKQTVSAGR